MKPDNIILEGVTGSKAYGLDTESSDTDIKGIYLLPTDETMSLGYNVKNNTKDHVDPDWVYHEVEKFIMLAMDSNPTILELLFLEDYTKLNEWGKLLVDNRNLFLSQLARKKYGGYALSQAKSLATNNGKYGNGRANRYEKHTRHLARLLWQGEELLTTGKITLKVSQEKREEFFALGKKSPDYVVSWFEKQWKHFNEVPSILPDEVDKKAINDILLKIRYENLQQVLEK